MRIFSSLLRHYWNRTLFFVSLTKNIVITMKVSERFLPLPRTAPVILMVKINDERLFHANVIPVKKSFWFISVSKKEVGS